MSARLYFTLEGSSLTIRKTSGDVLQKAFSIVGLIMTARPGAIRLNNDYHMKTIDFDYATVELMATALMEELDGAVLTTAQPDYTQSDNMAADFVKNKPTLGTAAATAAADYATAAQGAKADTALQPAGGATGTFNDKDSNVVTVVGGKITDLDT